MSTPVQSWLPAGEPLTPRGVAGFARASLGRLLLVQSMVALLAALSIVWFLERAWFPVIREAIHELPATGEIRDGQLAWTGDSPVALAENRFLGLAVDLNHSGQLGRAAQFQVEFGRTDLRISSMLGYVPLAYPAGYRIVFNRTELDPWWGAWEPVLAAGAAVLVIAGLMLNWALLATLYCGLTRLICFFGNRDLTWGESWRLSAAALLPGALFFTFAIICYSLNWIDWIRFAGMAGLQIIIGWIYLVVSPLFLPRHAPAAKAAGNPFAGPNEPPPPAEPASPNPAEND